MTQIKFHKKRNTFRFPDVEDTGTHGINDVVLLLPQSNLWLYFEK